MEPPSSPAAAAAAGHPSPPTTHSPAPTSTSPPPTTSSSTKTRNRTTSFSAATAILHRPAHPTEVREQESITSPFHMHPWSTERAKVAAETEISPPISPKQRALSGDTLRTSDLIEPLHSCNTSIEFDTPLPPVHSNSPYTHYHNLHLQQHAQDHDLNHNYSQDQEHHCPGTSSELLLSRTRRAPFHCTKKSIPQIVREISDVVDGRDKTIKVVQYFCKVFLWVFLSNPKQYAVLAARMKALAKQFSTTRKVLRLGHFIDPMASVLTLAVTLRANLRKNGLRRTLDKAPSQDWRNTLRDRLGSLNNVLGFVQDISDDIYCLGVIGVLDRSFTDKAEPWSNRLWMVGVSIDLHENLQTIRDVRRQIKAVEQNLTLGGSDEDEEAWRAQYTKLSTKLHWLQVTTVKLGGDFLFCGYDNLHCTFSDGFQAVSGFISGLAGAYKYVGKIMES
ncbi:hypothetical protein BGZ68_009260 [Mortierella alpina]|nr:hypothetical protein BGZ68_009260 [Mortierella alpina]